MIPVSQLRGSNGDEKDGEGGLVEDFSCDTLLEYINFYDPFMGFDVGEILPDLDVDPAEIFAEFSEVGEDLSGMAMAPGSAVTSDGGGPQEVSLEGEMKVEKDPSQREEDMSAATEEDPEAMEAEIRSPSSKVSRGPKSSAAATQNSQGKRKVKVDWTPELHQRFVQAVQQLGIDKAVPSRILELMGIESLTRHNVASHLQKYRSHRKHLLAREAVAAARARRDMNPWLAPVMGFPPPPTPPPSLPPFQPFRPLHVWGHPIVEPPLVPMRPRNLASWSPTPPRAPQPSLTPLPYPSFCHHHYQRSFPAPSVPGVLLHPFYRPVPPPANEHSGLLLRFDAYPASEINTDAAIGEVLAKPWLPLPIGLKPPSLESVVELLGQDAPKVPPASG